jgi:hypothetical protein
LAPTKLAKRRTGQVRGTIGDTRTEADFVSFLDNLFASAPPTAVTPYPRTHQGE